MPSARNSRVCSFAARSAEEANALGAMTHLDSIDSVLARGSDPPGTPRWPAARFFVTGLGRCGNPIVGAGAAHYFGTGLGRSGNPIVGGRRTLLRHGPWPRWPSTAVDTAGWSH